MFMLVIDGLFPGLSNETYRGLRRLPKGIVGDSGDEYHVFESQDVAGYVRQSDLAMVYLWNWRNGTQIKYSKKGFVKTNFKKEDFLIKECKAQTTILP